MAGQAEASFVGATERTVAFLDILAVAEGHALVVPRRHVVGLAGLYDAEGAQMFRLARQIASIQRDLGLAEGVNLILADGEVAGQEVFHVHLHVVARWEAGGVRLAVDHPPTARPSRTGCDRRPPAGRPAGGIPVPPDAPPITAASARVPRQVQVVRCGQGPT